MTNMGHRGGRGGGGGAMSGTRETRNHGRGGVNNHGGIQKRRAPSGPRLDSDGDLDMVSGGPRRLGGPAGGRTTRLGAQKAVQAINRHLSNNGRDTSLAARVTHGVHRATRPISRDQDRDGDRSMKTLRVHGLKDSKAANNEGGGLRPLLAFLERKASSGSKQVAIRKPRMDGDYVYILVPADHADAVLRLDGFTFAGAPLSIVEFVDAPDPSVPSAQETRAKLKVVLEQRYTADTKLLRLDALSQDPGLTELSMFLTKERAKKTFHVLMVICDGMYKSRKQKQDAIESISVANNGIDNVTQIETLAETFPDLKNLELSNNLLPNVEAVAAWRGRLRYLHTLHISGNPLVVNQPDYKSHLMAWFPRLQNIDGVQVRTAEQAEAAVAAFKKQNFIPQHGPDFRDSNRIGENFLLEFFAAYDSDRPGLLAKYYDESSKFSLSVDTNSVRSPGAPTVPPWAPYMRFSRNLVKVTAPSARVQRLFCGRNVIADLWKTLPATQHPDLKQQLQKYIMDCHLLPGLLDPSGQSPKGVDGMIISVHGEFDETDARTGTRGQRSFSRSFILGPGAPGGNPIRVVSDMLSLRACGQLPNIHNLTTLAEPQPQALPQIEAPPLAQVGAEELQRQALVAELSKQTGMTNMYSEMCLLEVGWDVARGVAMFTEKRAQLPAEAFVASS